MCIIKYKKCETCGKSFTCEATRGNPFDKDCKICDTCFCDECAGKGDCHTKIIKFNPTHKSFDINTNGKYYFE